MKILILSSAFPYSPTREGTQIRTFNLLKHLSKNHEITIMTRPNSDVSRTDIEALERLVKEVKIFPYSNAPKPSILGKINRFYDFIMQGTPPNVRPGFGMKFKTLESMDAGVSVVVSIRGLEGLTVEGNNVPLAALRANSIGEYCTEISRLFESAELREKLSRNARRLIEDNCTWQQAAGK